MLMKSLKVRKHKSFWSLRIHGCDAISVGLLPPEQHANCGWKWEPVIPIQTGAQHPKPSSPSSRLTEFLSRVKTKILGKEMALVTPGTNQFLRGRTHEPGAKSS